MIKNSHRKIAQWCAALGGVGFLKPASATWGSLWAGIILFLFWPTVSIVVKSAVIISTFFLGILLTKWSTHATQLHDPHFIVIDEAVGMMITTIALEQIWWQFAIAFLFFRIFDIAKIWPASFFDKQKNNFSVMFDDVIMAIPALACTQITLWLIGALHI